MLCSRSWQDILKIDFHSENFIGDYQSRFSQGRSLADQILTLREIQVTSYKLKLKIRLLFLDFQQADDTITREDFYFTLNVLGIPTNLG